MSADTYSILFLIGWLVLMAYVLSAARLAFAVRAMKQRGELLDAPRLFELMDGFKSLAWLLSGRFEREGDETVVRWSRITRIMFFVVTPPTFLLVGTSIVSILF